AIGNGVAAFGAYGLPTLPGEAIRRRLLRLYSDNLHFRAQVLGGGSDASYQSCVTDRNINRIDLRKLLENFAGDGCGAGGQIRIGCIVEEVDSITPGVGGGELESFGQVDALLHDGCA